MGKHKKQITRKDGATQAYWVGTDTLPPTPAPTLPGHPSTEEQPRMSLMERLRQKFSPAPAPMSQEDLDVETSQDMEEYTTYLKAQPTAPVAASRWDWDTSGYADPATDASRSEAWSFDDASGAE